jgi:diaminopimelate epimerase
MSASFRIAKMSGAGNDFVVVSSEVRKALGDRFPSWVRRVCRRGLSVGADGVLVIEPRGEGRVGVAFLNPDASPAFCGNGSRCAARYALLHGLATPAMALLTSIGEVPAEVHEDRVSLTLPPPEAGARATLEIGARKITGLRVAAGVPHFVIWMDGIGDAPLHEIAPPVRAHSMFAPEGTNVDLVSFRGDGAVAVRTWERGVEGETLSCGTGAIAAAFAARLCGGAEAVRVIPASGVPLEVRILGPVGSPRCAVLEGDARVIFEGELDAEATAGFEGA